MNWIESQSQDHESNRIKSLPECIVTPLMSSDTFMQMSLIYYSIMVNFHENSMIFQPNFQNICWIFGDSISSPSCIGELERPHKSSFLFTLKGKTLIKPWYPEDFLPLPLVFNHLAATLILIWNPIPLYMQSPQSSSLTFWRMTCIVAGIFNFLTLIPQGQWQSHLQSEAEK